ncbi:MAG: 4Fe-4S binding protein [Chloroflexi bacterium]|nr:4Fe-4S binding protein [Chloroflexota bacterium]
MTPIRTDILSAIEALLRSRHYPGLLQVGSLLVFAAILFFSFAGNPHGESNLAVAITWYIWWVLLPFSAVVFGRVWCSFCPISTISRGLLGFVGGHGRLNQTYLLKSGSWIGGVLLLVLSWAIIIWRIDEMPAATGILLSAFTAGAIVFGLLFGERMWCKSACPIGAVIGLYSRLAPLQIRPAQRTCAVRCGRTGNCHAMLLSQNCLNDGPVSSLRSNQRCSLCGDCLKSCRHSSVELRLGVPEAFAAQPSKMSSGETAVLMLLLSLVLMDLLRMTPWYPSLMKRLMTGGFTIDYNVVLALAILLLALCLFALYQLVAWVSGLITGQTLRQTGVLLASPYIALAAAVHLGSELFHLASHGTTPLLAVAFDLGFPVEFPAVVRGAKYSQDSMLQSLELILILIAIALAVRAFWKPARCNGARGVRRALFVGLSAVFTILIAAAAGFLFISPMGLIH